MVAAGGTGSLFEECGGVVGSLDAISDAATWDEQLSEGKAPSEREEAVLTSIRDDDAQSTGMDQGV